MAGKIQVRSLSGFLARRLIGKGARGVEVYLAITGAVLLVVVVSMTLLSPYIAPYNPIIEVGPALQPPSSQFPMGTDHLGRDVYSRVIYGSIVALEVSMISSLLSSLIGTPFGLLSGFLGGKTDRLFSIVMDSIYAFPGLILAIAIAAMMGPGVINMSIAIAVVYIPTYFRMIRGQVLSIKEELYVDAARALGARNSTILFRYIFANVIPSLVVVLSLNIADAILTEAGLSYLGLGIPPPTPDWGFDLSKGKSFLPGGYWWMITFPGLMIVIVVLGFSLLGEGLNQILNPRLRER
jgi:peptide/nickel transport system permease protein